LNLDSKRRWGQIDSLDLIIFLTHPICSSIIFDSIS
jgi:hypothetical protein